MKRLKNKYIPALSNLMTLFIFCGLQLTTLMLVVFGQINLWIYVVTLFAAPTLLIYILVFALCYFLRINVLPSIGLGGCFISAALYIVVLIIWNKSMFSPNLINLSCIAIGAIVSTGLIHKFIIRKNAKIRLHMESHTSENDRLVIRDKIIMLFFKNIALSLLIILPIQFFSSAPYVPQWDAWDLSEFKWAERLFSMSCALWVIAASAYFLRLNRDVLTSKRVQATMAAIFLICGLATTLLFKNTILVWSALAAPIIYLLLQNRLSKTNDRDLSHSS